MAKSNPIEDLDMCIKRWKNANEHDRFLMHPEDQYIVPRTIEFLEELKKTKYGGQ